MTKTLRMRGLRVTGALFVLAGSCALANLLLLDHQPLSEALADTSADYEVEIVVPKVPTNKRKGVKEGFASPEGEDCTTGCSLGKHAIPDFTINDFYKAMEGYAAAAASAEGEDLDTLLFHRKRTLDFLETEGTEPLSPEHVQFLRRELGRENAIVTIRMVDEHGRTRVTYGPEEVPLGEKQHLAPAEVGNLFAMEFNGTVMRTGLYHLWSRY